jgi:large subunit ribosomal protein LX
VTEVKVFRVVGKITKPNYKADFRKEIRALKPEEAVEKVYNEIGSNHRAKRVQIKVLKVEEIGLEDVSDPTIRKLMSGERESGGK